MALPDGPHACLAIWAFGVHRFIVAFDCPRIGRFRSAFYGLAALWAACSLCPSGRMHGQKSCCLSLSTLWTTLPLLLWLGCSAPWAACCSAPLGPEHCCFPPSTFALPSGPLARFALWASCMRALCAVVCYPRFLQHCVVSVMKMLGPLGRLLALPSGPRACTKHSLLVLSTRWAAFFTLCWACSALWAASLLCPLGLLHARSIPCFCLVHASVVLCLPVWARSSPWVACMLLRASYMLAHC